MTTDVAIVLGIVVATVVGIAISFFKTESVPEIDPLDPSIRASLEQLETLEKLKEDLEEIKQTLQDRVEE